MAFGSTIIAMLGFHKELEAKHKVLSREVKEIVDLEI
jgi:hypothetical protein